MAFDESPAYDISAGGRLWLCKTTQDAPVAVDDQEPLAMKAMLRTWDRMEMRQILLYSHLR